MYMKYILLFEELDKLPGLKVLGNIDLNPKKKEEDDPDEKEEESGDVITKPSKTCPSGKIVYRRKRYAQEILKNINDTIKSGRSSSKLLKTIYKCNMCGNWHLSSKTKEEYLNDKSISSYYKDKPLIHMKRFKDLLSH